MPAKLTPEKKRTKGILMPLNIAELSVVKKLAAARGVSIAQIFREGAGIPQLIAREVRKAQRGAKKTEAA